MTRLPARALLLLAASLFAACRDRSPGAPDRSTPVVLISIDTLRSDHLPAYGYSGVQTPAIDALRSESILFRRAYSHTPLTLPSHVTILSGLLPADTGVRDNIGFRLGDSLPMIQGLLRSNGYVTGAAVSAYVLRRETGIARGFDFFDDEVEPLGSDESTIGRVQRDGRQSLQVLQSWLDKQSGKPFFAFLHLYEPHSPYTPPQPFRDRYPNRYDGEIAYADSIVGELLEHLKQRGLYDKALIILLSDHGEGLNDHGEEEHGIFVYREALQVPLLVKLPGQRRGGTEVGAPVGLADVFPTILDRTATPLPPHARPAGQSLLTMLDKAPARQIYAESYYPRLHFGWSDVHSLIAGDDHLIRAPQPELYNLQSDPAERHNVLEQNRRTYVHLREAIEPYVREAAAPSSIDPEDAAKLAALGYVGSSAPAHPGQELADPKSTVGTFHDIRLAFTLYRNGKQEDALGLTNRLLAENEQITDLWDLKFKILGKMGRHKEAVQAAKDGLRHVPAAVQLLYDVASGALALGDLDDAQQHAELARKVEPGRAHEILARVWLRRGDVDRAEAEARLALQTSHDPTNALIQLASAEKQRGNLTAALGFIDRAVERASHKPAPTADLHLARGDILARLGRNAEAEQEFRTEIARFPASANAHSSLILLLAASGRTDEATQLVFDLVKASPAAHSYSVVSETLQAIGDDQGALFWAYQGLKRYPKDEELSVLTRKLRVATPVTR